jgi:drug/metabolite transporter (DMT)-like permease
MVNPLDTTTIGIVAGLVVAGSYSLTRALRQKSFDIGATMLMFLAGFAIPGGAHLISAALSGNPSTLPSNWREYVAVAGIAAIGLSLQQIVKSFRNAWVKRAAMAPTNPNDAVCVDDPAS